METTSLWTSGRPDGHAPTGVMGDHTHHKGDWMFSYRYMYMRMDGMRDGNDDISASEIYPKGYMVSPVEMDMKMHMLGAMHAVSDKVTLMTMINYLENDMLLQAMNGNQFNTKSSGFGDLKVSAIYQLLNKDRQELHAIVGVSVPTGNIEEKDATPMSAPSEILLPYPMQLGSGTVDAILGLTYLGEADVFSWGNQVKADLRFGKNTNEYRYGNMYTLNNWFAVKTTPWLSFSARVEGKIVDDITGINPGLNPMMVTTADVNNSGGQFINGALGFNTYVPSGTFKDIRLGFEFSYPLYQHLEGVQLAHKESLTVGLQYAF